MIRIRTKGSMWVIDEGAKRYCRFPLDEGGREHPWWGNEEAGALQDAVWHDYETWQITRNRQWEVEGEWLRFDGPEGPVNAPFPEVL